MVIASPTCLGSPLECLYRRQEFERESDVVEPLHQTPLSARIEIESKSGARGRGDALAGEINLKGFA